MSLLPTHPAQDDAHSRVGALLGLVSKGQLATLLHVDEEGLHLLLIAQGEGNFSRNTDIAKVTRLAVDTDHASQSALRKEKKQHRLPSTEFCLPGPDSTNVTMRFCCTCRQATVTNSERFLTKMFNLHFHP